MCGQTFREKTGLGIRQPLRPSCFTAAPFVRGRAATTSLQRVKCCRPGRSRQGGVVRCLSGAAAAPAGDLSNSLPAPEEMWDLGFADCEASTCGLIPDGAIVMVPFRKHPSARDQRLKELEEGVALSEDKATYVGAVPSDKINFLLDSPVVSGEHARIEGILDEAYKSPWWAFGKAEGPRVRYYVTDLKSTNGTFLNRGKLRPLMPAEIRPGDIVSFGNLKNAYRVVQAMARKGFSW